MPSVPQFRDNTAAARYELQGDGGVAFLTYKDSRGHRILVHTEVPPEVRGEGMGSRLVRAALEDARAHGRPVVPACEFVKAYLQRHPEFADVLAGPGKAGLN